MMNFIDKAVNFINPKAGLQRARARTELQIMNYAQHGASKSKDSLIGMNVTGNSPDYDTTRNIKTLRARSRDLWMGGTAGTAALKTLRTNVIGKGLTCKPQIDHEFLGIDHEKARELELAIEREWLLWSESANCDAERKHNFYTLQRLTFLSKLMNGDAFVTMPYKERKGSPYTLTVQLIEGDRVTNPIATEGKDIIEGVEVKNGEVVAYHIGQTTLFNNYSYGDFVRLEAYGKLTGEKMVLHLFEPERAGQRRGVPMLSSVIEHVQQLSRYTKAEINRAVLMGVLTAVITKGENDSNPLDRIGLSDEEKITNDKNKIELGQGNFFELEPGEDIKTISGASNNQLAFEAFFNAVVTQIGACLEIPRGILMKSFNASYSASRAELLEFWKVASCEHSYMSLNFCQPIYERFLIEAISLGRLDLPGFMDNPLKRKAYSSCKWVGQSKGHLDPLKEVNAAKAKVDYGFSTIEIEAQEMGNDWDEVQAQRVIEQRMRVKGGLEDAKQKVLGVQEPSGGNS